MSKLLIIGAGGHAKSVLDCVLSRNEYNEIGFAADYGFEELHGYPVVGTLRDISKLHEIYDYAVVAIGDNAFRLQMTDFMERAGFCLPPIIHKTAHVCQYCSIGAGSVVLANTAINMDSKIGKACIVNTNTSIDHDCIIANGVHLSPNSVICGGVKIGEGTWVCSGATVIDHITIGKKAIIGAGSVVLHDVFDNQTVYGVPAKPISKSTP